MQVQEHAESFGELGFRLVAVGFSPADGLAPVADHIDWRGPFLSDTERLLYGRLDIGRAGRLEVFNPGTMRIYRDATARGEAVHRPVEDIRQLGGDVFVVDGVAVLLARPETPDDRAPVADLLTMARDL